MTKRKPRELAAEASRTNRELCARLGQELRLSRKRRRLTQARLGAMVGLAQSTVSDIELGRGGSHTMDAWQRLAIALDRPLSITLPRDPNEEPADAGHLAIQELVLRTSKPAGWDRRVELATKPSDPSRSTDVALISSRLRAIALVECVNVLGDFGASMRSSDHKRAEVEQYAATLARPEEGEGAYTISVCWVLRDVRRNRELVNRYPQIFASRFPGSSVGWLQALTQGARPPVEPGLVWCDARALRLFARRRVPN